MSELPNYTQPPKESSQITPSPSAEQEESLRKGIDTFLKKADEQNLKYSIEDGVRKYHTKEYIDVGTVNKKISVPEEEAPITKENTAWNLHTKKRSDPNTEYDFFINTGDAIGAKDTYLKILNSFLKNTTTSSEEQS
jgi:hypothetical protein